METFILQAFGEIESTVDGQYLTLGPRDIAPTGEDGGNFQPDILSASAFTISDSTGILSSLHGSVGGPEFANLESSTQKKKRVALPVGTNFFTLRFDTDTQISERDGKTTNTEYSICEIGDDQQLTCDTADNTIFVNCPRLPGLRVGPAESSPAQSQCQLIKLTAIPLPGAAINNECLPAPVDTIIPSVTAPTVSAPAITVTPVDTILPSLTSLISAAVTTPAVTIAPSVTIPAASTSVCISSPAPSGTFVLQVSGSTLDGQYITQGANPGVLPDGQDGLNFQTDIGAAAAFTLGDLDGRLTTIDDEFVNLEYSPLDRQPPFFAPLLVNYDFEVAARPSFTEETLYTTCTLVDGALSCVTGPNTVFYSCSFSSGLRVGPPNPPDACQALTLNAVPAPGSAATTGGECVPAGT